MSRKPWRSAVAGYGAAAVLAVLILVLVMRLWQADLTVPFAELGDGLLTLTWIKTIMENGWYLHNRFLGMPAGLAYYDFPLIESLHFALLKLLSLVFPNYAVVYNLYYLLTYPLCTVAALFVFRRFGVSYGPALVGSLLFACLPYHFFKCAGALFLAAYYLVPFAVLVVLWVWQGAVLVRPEPESGRLRWQWRSGRTAAAFLICVLLSSAGVYYAFFTCFFLLAAGLGGCLVRRRLYPLGPALLLVAVICVGVLANLTPTLRYHYRHGPNPYAVVRSPQDAESYGMKLAQLVLPVSEHRLPALAQVRARYTADILNENDATALGAVGAAGFLFLLGYYLSRLCPGLQPAPLAPSPRTPTLLDGLSTLNLYGFLLCTVGSFGALFSLFAGQLIRCYCRGCIFLGFFGLFAVVILLDGLCRRLAAGRGRLPGYGLLGLVLLGGLYDQTTPQFVLPYAALKAKFLADQAFVRAVEEALPEGAMVFQLPYVRFPEYPPVVHMTDYALLRGYLHSRKLRWSYGAMKGREGDCWQRRVAAQPIPEMLRTLALAGFDGIYLDRQGFADQGAEVEAELARVLGTPPLVSAPCGLACFNLSTFRRRLEAAYPPAEWQARREAALHPLLISWEGGFSDLEETPERSWRWCGPTGELLIFHSGRGARTLTLRMQIESGNPAGAELNLSGPLWHGRLPISREPQAVEARLRVEPGEHVIHFRCSGKPLRLPTDPRILSFRVLNFSWSATEAEAETVVARNPAPP